MANPIRIVVTGPESTAKSTLSQQLAFHFDGVFYPEFARLYLDENGADYTYEDVERIARGQLEQYQQSLTNHSDIVFFDTWLIITKIWFDWVFQKSPAWIETEIDDHPIDLYLLCLPDIPWVSDPLREHGGQDRIRLYESYRKELENRQADFIEIGGEGKIRLENAIRAVNSIYVKKFV